MRALLRSTIWHPDAMPDARDATAKELKRYVLPYFDGIIIIMAIVAVNLGMPSFDIVFNAHISAFSSWTLLVAAIMAAVGLIFQLPRLEGAGKLLMVPILSGYAAALWALVWQGADGRGVVAAAFTGLLALPLWTLWRINREQRARREDEEAAAAVAAAIAESKAA